MTKGLKRRLKRMILKTMPKEVQWRWHRRSLEDTYKPLIAQATGDKHLSLLHDFESQLEEIHREMRVDSDFKLIRKARRYGIPIPSRHEEDDTWEQWEPGFWLLTEKGSYRLKKAIQEEQKAALALWKARIDPLVPLITGIVGLIGVLIGLLAILRK